MKLLTVHHPASPAGMDFCHGIEGELAVAFYIGCRNPDCGCDRALIGLNSSKGSTTVMVREVDITLPDALIACRAYIERAGWDELLCGNNPHRVTELVDHLMADSAQVASRYPVGTVLRASCNHDTGQWAYRHTIH